MTPNPRIPDDLQEGVSICVQTKYGPLRGGQTTNGAVVFLEVPYALPPVRFMDPQPLPEGYQYENKQYVFETKYCYQPDLGLNAMSEKMAAVHSHLQHIQDAGEPSEDPLFLNIVAPSSFTSTSKFPVKIFIHGGFLQYGSPHELNSQAQYVSQERSEVWVNIGYRLSVLGFLASDEPKVDGNFGFKDQWLGLLWVRDNIAAFGGDPDNIQLTGFSGGSHAVHQILHHISRLPEGQSSPIRSAVLQSNGILNSPKTPEESRSHFTALCHALELDPKAPNVLDILRDPVKVPPAKLMSLIATDTVEIPYGTFRGCFDDSWMATDSDPMTWQRNGNFGRKLHEKGMKSIVLGDLPDEWFGYAFTHMIHSPVDIIPNLLRYYPQSIIDVLLPKYPPLAETTTENAWKFFGQFMANGQVHMPVRLLARDLKQADFPVLRYEILWTPEQLRPFNLVTHGTDRCMWALRIPSLIMSQKEKTVEWLDAIDREVKKIEREGCTTRSLKETLTLRADQSIGWSEDARWDLFMDMASVLPGE